VGARARPGVLWAHRALAVLVSRPCEGRLQEVVAEDRGDRRVVEDAMSRGLVSWEGVVHNITYLGLEWPIKRVVGDWWRRWAKMEVGTSRVAEQEAKWLDEDDDGGEGEGREVPLSGQDSDEEGDVDGLQKARRSSEVDAAVEGMLGALNKL